MFQNEIISQDSTVTLNKLKSKSTDQYCHYHCNNILLFIIFGFIFLAFAMVELITNLKEQKHVIPIVYDPANKIMFATSAHLTFKAKSISFYLHIEKISQYNYTNKYEGQRLQQFTSSAGNCQVYKSNKHVMKQYNTKGETLNQNDFAVPCGYYPSMFPGQDMQMVFNNKTIPLLSKNQIEFKQGVHDIDLSKQWVSLESSLFQDWMEHNVHLDTMKRISHITEDSFQGVLSFRIPGLNQLRDNGKHNMYLIVSDNQALGGKNEQFCISSIISCIIMFIFASLIYLYNKIQQQKLKNNSSLPLQLKLNSPQKYNFE